MALHIVADDGDLYLTQSEHDKLRAGWERHRIFQAANPETKLVEFEYFARTIKAWKLGLTVEPDAAQHEAVKAMLLQAYSSSPAKDIIATGFGADSSYILKPDPYVPGQEFTDFNPKP